MELAETAHTLRLNETFNGQGRKKRRPPCGRPYRVRQHLVGRKSLHAPCVHRGPTEGRKARDSTIVMTFSRIVRFFSCHALDLPWLYSFAPSHRSRTHTHTHSESIGGRANSQTRRPRCLFHLRRRSGDFFRCLNKKKKIGTRKNSFYEPKLKGPHRSVR